jgi:hypothetical protein
MNNVDLMLDSDTSNYHIPDRLTLNESNIQNIVSRDAVVVRFIHFGRCVGFAKGAVRRLNRVVRLLGGLVLFGDQF